MPNRSKNPQNFLKKVRQEKRLGQAQLAEKIGVSRQMIWGYESGKYEISSESLNKLAAVLSVDPNYILTGKVSNSEKLGEIDKTKMIEAIKTTHEFYKDYNFDQETMSKIAVEVYSFMSDFNKLAKEIGNKDFDKSLNDKIISGLAARCFVDLKNNLE